MIWAETMVISSAKMVIQLARNAGLRSNDGDLMGINGKELI